MRFIGRDQFVGDGAPANLAGDQGHDEVRDVEERNDDGQEDVDPGLAHDLGAQGRQTSVTAATRRLLRIMPRSTGRK